ncbi:hypothetical protein A3K63_02600 [Candidatus Micrarchaeota archaeon RBG_16_49_10]|nr:MAG: hypothetical protein A3K63_02600 [Candidatus Micrarchaeota archaeon RBG_16_49_10]
MNDEEVVFKLIKMGCEEQDEGQVYEEKVLRMAQLLNINLERYQKVKTRLLETGKVAKTGDAFFLP